MPRLFQNELDPQINIKIYQQILNLGTPRKSSQKGKLKKTPAFRHGKNLQQYGNDRIKYPEPRLEFYNFHYTRGNKSVLPSPPPPPPRELIYHDFRRQPNTSPCPSPVEELKAWEDEEAQGINMKKTHTATASVNNTQPVNKNLFLSCTPNERKYVKSAQGMLWNTSFQSLRLDQEWNAKSECRATKRTTQIMQHRTDRRYMMNGSALKIQPRYNVADEDIQYLRELSKARQVIKAQVQEEKQINKTRSISGLKIRGKKKPRKLPPLTTKQQTTNDEERNISVSVAVVKLDDDNQEFKGTEGKKSETTSVDHREEEENDKTLHPESGEKGKEEETLGPESSEKNKNEETLNPESSEKDKNGITTVLEENPHSMGTGMTRLAQTSEHKDTEEQTNLPVIKVRVEGQQEVEKSLTGSDLNSNPDLVHETKDPIENVAENGAGEGITQADLDTLDKRYQAEDGGDFNEWDDDMESLEEFEVCHNNHVTSHK
ncbi:uncharacterized protein LOC126816150 isoform X2 [Patella vulgata]|uniref:uncharacterized protein LOC126816150 isoform X2 n=1 Tax=Patella vulgata TaxID=6465 RepID=UPI00217FD140|nr:uncharacterized protein LOC126816150 isoform X2 [Patella vulgata]